MSTLPHAAPVQPLTADQSAALASLVAGFSPEQLTWASGFLAGLAAANGQPVAATPPAAAPQADETATLTILYGSQTGHGETVAEQVAEKARGRGLKVSLASMADYPAARLRREKFLLAVVSTHGDGDPPDDAVELHEFLASRRAPKLEGLQFGVLALGDSSYAQFCQTGKEFDERLAALGATRLHDRVDCDVDFEDPAAAWAEAVVARAYEEIRPDRPSLEIVAAPAPAKVADRWTKESPFAAELLVNQPITAPGSTKDVRHFEIALDGDDAPTFQAGDSLGVLPSNPPDTVARIIEALGLDAESPVTITDDGGAIPLEAALTHHREITLLNRPVLERWADVADSDELKALIAGEGEVPLHEWMKGHQFLDVARAWPADVEAQALVDLLRPLAPRLYSIASDPESVPGEVHLTVAVVDDELDGEPRPGAASTWLSERLAEGDTVPVFVERNDRFRLPASADAPIIMVGPGTGVAPFRAFLQAREAAGAEGRNWLIFGDREFRKDFLYQAEWLRYRRQGLLTRLDAAFSRDQAEKVYVQDRMREHGAELFAWLEDGAHFYVCGDATRMAPDVEKALLEIIQQHGDRDAEGAKEYLSTLRRAGRYQRDVY